jgi:Protein of unknown function (DUF3151)
VVGCGRLVRVNLSSNLLGGPPPTFLPDDESIRTALDGGTPAAELAAAAPSACLPWAVLAEDALAAGSTVEAYAYARTGYHRGLDALRRGGWKGHGPVPWSHVPNRGFLRALAALGQAASLIGETAERDRISAFVADCDPEAVAALRVSGWSA